MEYRGLGRMPVLVVGAGSGSHRQPQSRRNREEPLQTRPTESGDGRRVVRQGVRHKAEASARLRLRQAAQLSCWELSADSYIHARVALIWGTGEEKGQGPSPQWATRPKSLGQVVSVAVKCPFHAEPFEERPREEQWPLIPLLGDV